jgi:hypothetical protein
MMQDIIKTLKNTYKVEEHDDGVIHVTDERADSYISFRDREHLKEFLNKLLEVIILPKGSDTTNRYVGKRGKYDYK